MQSIKLSDSLPRIVGDSIIRGDKLTIIATVLILVVYISGHFDLGLLERRLEVVRDA